MTENRTVRDAAKAAKIPLWKIAAAIHVSEPTLIRWLRFPLSAEKEQRILTAIATIERKEAKDVAQADV